MIRILGIKTKHPTIKAVIAPPKTATAAKSLIFLIT